MEYEFNTKLGKCKISPEEIVLSRSGITGAAIQKVYGDSMSRRFIIYSIIAAIMVIFGIWLLIRDDYMYGGLLCIIGALYIWNVIISRNNSATNKIERSEVKKVVAHYPHPPFTRGYFTVYFLREGKSLKRLIMLPGSMSGGKEEFQRAILAMRETGWYRKY